MTGQTYEPMIVERVYTGGGSHIEPPFDESWSDLDRLRWEAGVVKADTGITVYIETGKHRHKRFGRWVVTPNVYSFSYQNVGHSAMSASAVHLWLQGFSAGARAQRVAVDNDAVALGATDGDNGVAGGA